MARFVWLPLVSIAIALGLRSISDGEPTPQAGAAPAKSESRFELRGQLEPAPGTAASVYLYGALTPYQANSLSDSKGRFRFPRLLAGSYTVSVFVPGYGEVRQTVEVSPSFADSKGRVNATIRFEPTAGETARSLQEAGKVSVRELSIPEEALREYARAAKKLERRDVAGATEHLRRAVSIAPQFVQAWNHLGTIHYQTAAYEEAERCFREALKHDPGAPSPTVNLGGTLLNLGRHDEALHYNRYAVATNPGDALAHSQLGMNYYFLGDLDRATEHLNKAKRLDPAHFSRPQLVLAEVYLLRADKPRAIAELEDYLARHPDDPDSARIKEKIESLRGP